MGRILIEHDSRGEDEPQGWDDHIHSESQDPPKVPFDDIFPKYTDDLDPSIGCAVGIFTGTILWGLGVYAALWAYGRFIG